MARISLAAYRVAIFVTTREAERTMASPSDGQVRAAGTNRAAGG